MNKQDTRLDLAHRQPNADAANAVLAQPFHGRNATEMRRMYIRKYGDGRQVANFGEDLVQAVRDTFNKGDV